MVVPAFGFSTGDFISLIRLTGKALKALRDTDGAASQYQQAVIDLELLRSVLLKVQSLKPGTHNVAIVQDVQRGSHACHLPLAHFLTKLRSFEEHLRPVTRDPKPRNLRKYASKRLGKGYHQLKWVMELEEELSRLKASIGPALQLIDILLQLISLQTTEHSNQILTDAYHSAQKLLVSFEDLKGLINDKFASAGINMLSVPLLDQFRIDHKETSVKLLGLAQSTQVSVEDMKTRISAQEQQIHSMDQRLEAISHIMQGEGQRQTHSMSQPALSLEGRLTDYTGDGRNLTPYYFYLVLDAVRTGATQLLLVLLELFPLVQHLLRSTAVIMRTPRLYLTNKQYVFLGDTCLEKLKTLLLRERVRGGQDGIVSFLPHGVARKVFKTNVSLLRELYNAADVSQRQRHDQSTAFLAAVIGEDDSHALSNILATLLYGPIGPNSKSWKKFEDLCKQPREHRKISDGTLPLSRQDVGEFLGEENIHIDNFWTDQYMFSPIVLEKGTMIDSTQGRILGRFPYLHEAYLKGGLKAKVYRVVLAGNYFGLAVNGQTICARKDYDISRARIFEAEWTFREVLFGNTRRNENILEIFAGFRTPTSLSLFCELADCNLDDFMEIAEPPKSLMNIEHRLVQFNGIVRAVEFLHTQIVSKNGVREACFHLNIKPKNILVVDMGKKEEIFKISDFSVSCVKSQGQGYEDSERSLKQQKSVRDMTTLALLGDANTCLAPEAFGREGRVNASNDIWHLGCTLCMFIAWLHRGPKGLQDFHESRFSAQQGADWFFFVLEQEHRPSDDETEYWRQVWNGQKFFIFRFSLTVEDWLNDLEERTKRSPEASIYSTLARILKNEMLIADPQKRNKIENVRRSLESMTVPACQQSESERCRSGSTRVKTT